MATLTRSNIAYDLRISPHEQVIHYPDTSIRYVFSSELYKNNFYVRLQDNRDKINQSISKRFGISVRANIIADLKLYVSIEKRGFLIEKDKEVYHCLNDIILDGMRMIPKS